MRAPLVFIHGWGFNASVWDKIIDQLPDMSTSTTDFGFIGNSAASELVLPDNVIIVAHSLGVLWALKHLPAQTAGFVSICGFDRFSPPVSRKSLALMQKGLVRNPMAQMTHFWRSCGIKPFADQEQLNQQALSEGLDWLMDWDGRLQLEKLTCPMHVMASKDDEIVPIEMSRDIWVHKQINWSNTGGHGLPLTRPGWCADQIRQFVEENE